MPPFVDSITGRMIEHDESSFSGSSSSTGSSSSGGGGGASEGGQIRCYSNPAYLPAPTGRAPCVEYIVHEYSGSGSCIVETVLWECRSRHMVQPHLRRDNLTWLCPPERKTETDASKTDGPSSSTASTSVSATITSDDAYRSTTYALDATLVTFSNPSGMPWPLDPPTAKAKAKHLRIKSSL